MSGNAPVDDAPFCYSHRLQRQFAKPLYGTLNDVSP